MLRLFFKVDSDYGNRVAIGLGFKEGDMSIFQKLGKAVGLNTDMKNSIDKQKASEFDKSHLAASDEKMIK